MDASSFIAGAVATLLLLLFIAWFGRAIYGFFWSSVFLLSNAGPGAWFRYLKDICGFNHRRK